jgi:23S rRNA (adenine1618-N6)-methyltransferase
MPDSSKKIPEEKHLLHPRNKHRDRYNFPELITACGELEKYVSANQHKDLSVDFTNPDAVKTLNKALLNHFYKVSLWDIPDGYLCPAVPGRADYIHYIADLLADSGGKIPKGKSVKVLDIGVGANCIYPLIGHHEYGWSFVGSETDPYAIKSAKNIIEANFLTKAISIRKQNTGRILEGMVNTGENFDLVICNPPFHSSLQEAMESSSRKWKNLNQGKFSGSDMNFGGRGSELWCEGGELKFVSQLITESAAFGGSVRWFTSLISKKDTLPGCYGLLKKLKAAEVKTIAMEQGQKVSRILAWRF